MKIGMGAIIGLVGGLLVIVGTFLPWANVTGGGVSEDVTGAMVPIFGLLVILFGVLGLVFAVIPRPVFGILAMVFGILALVFLLIAYLGISLVSGISGGSVSLSYGLYLALIGAILLIVGGPLAYRDAKRAQAPPMPMPMAPPPPPA